MGLPPLELVEPKPRWRRAWQPFAGMLLVAAGSIAFGLLRHEHNYVVTGLGLSVFVVVLAALSAVVATLSVRRDAVARARWLSQAPADTLFVARAARGRLPADAGPKAVWPRFGLLIVSVDGVSFIHSRNPTDSAETSFGWPEIATLRVDPSLPARGVVAVKLRTGGLASWQASGLEQLQRILALFADNPVEALNRVREARSAPVPTPPVWRMRTFAIALTLLGTTGVAIEAVRGKPGIVISAFVLLAGLALLRRSFQKQPTTPGTTAEPADGPNPK